MLSSAPSGRRKSCTHGRVFLSSGSSNGLGYGRESDPLRHPRPPKDIPREKRQRTRTGRAPDARRTRAVRLPDTWRTRAGRAPDARRTRAEPFLPDPPN
eukprot:gene15450-biopygen658